jgi:predicted small secreted protein
MQKAWVIICLGLLVACNTMKGVGQDIQAAGNAITGGAESGRRSINR